MYNQNAENQRNRDELTVSEIANKNINYKYFSSFLTVFIFQQSHSLDSRELAEERVFIASGNNKVSRQNLIQFNYGPAGTTGGEEEPVHEDAGTVVVRIVGQQSVPLVLLLTGTVSVTPQSEATAADLLVDGLVELLVVEDGPHLPVAVAGPEGRGHLNL